MFEGRDMFGNRWQSEGTGIMFPDPPYCYDELFYTTHEIKAYERIMANQLRLGSDETDHWLTKLKYGDDEPIKGMLIALAPHLNRVTFISSVVTPMLLELRS